MPHPNTETAFNTTFGIFELHRRPLVSGLKAWDGVDDYLLELTALELAAAHTLTSALVINDTFGALACALHHLSPTSWSDSFTAHAATRDNYVRNQLPSTFDALPATNSPQQRFDLVLWRVPKSIGLFEQQVALLHAALHPQTVVLAGGMDKHLLPDTKSLLARLGVVTTLPGKRKSHVFRVDFDATLPLPRAPKNPEITVPEFDLTLSSDANVFAREKIDIGARFFIEQFSQLPPPRTQHVQRIADLGCGSGILSLALAKLRPAAEIHGFDESYQAVACARANWGRNIGATHARFDVGDGLGDYTGAPFDLILCNPPFHQQHVIGDHIARQLFAQAKQHLRPDGELWVVGNRHLDYHLSLKRLFGRCRQIASNAKFVVLAAGG
jgi:16S rRNA G1207 methylase RsmC